MKLNANFVFGAVLALILTVILAGTKDSTLSPLPTFIIFFLVCYPWKVDGHVWSLFGGFNNDGNVYSLCGIAQHASGKTTSLVGVSLYQYAGKEAFQLLGVSIYQYSAGTESHPASPCGQAFGISLWMKAKAGYLGQVIGIIVYQEGEEGGAIQLLGVVLFQKARAVCQTVGFCGIQIATEKEQKKENDPGEAEQSFGIVLYQKAEQRVYQAMGMRLFAEGIIKQGKFGSITIAERSSSSVLPTATA